MTPRQARLALGGFLLLAGGVAINALFLQSGPIVARDAARSGPSRGADRAVRSHRPAQPPVPTASSKANDERSQRIARLRPDSAKIDLMPAPAGESDVETIRAIQRELAQRGYGPLPSDGVLRALTGAAIMAYEYDHGLALTGEASDALLKRILLGAPGGSDQAGAGKARSARAEQLIGSMQHALAALGYQPGRLDGQLGEETSRAIREFEMDKGLVPKGRISAELMLRLTEAAAASKPSSR